MILLNNRYCEIILFNQFAIYSMRLFKFLLLSVTVLLSSQIQADVEHHFAQIKSDPNALYAFLKAMPKGGELHYHLAGGAYPETMLAIAENDDFCLNPHDFSMNRTQETCTAVSSKKLFQQPELYEATVRAWSLKNFTAGPESKHDHFFASFFKFMSIVSDFRPQLLASIMQRAANQNEQYLEIIILPDDARSTAFGPLIAHHPSLKEKRAALLENKAFKTNVTHTIKEAKRILQQARETLHCNVQPQQPACQVTIRFQYYVLREQAFSQVVAQAVNAFEAASQSEDIVGVNLVQAEDGLIALRDYKKHMDLFDWLHTMYPNVHIALHAGELSPTAVSPEDLNFHICQAVFKGHAERIGHGVTIAYEDQAMELIEYMAKKPVPVEINLTSNREILDVQGKEHPLNYYLNHQVPVVLSTDDEGILRTDLTRQYVDAVLEHQLDYASIRTINRNALTYSFLAGKSLWQDPVRATPVPECQNLNSASCRNFIDQNEKARLQWQLENRLQSFEKGF